LPKTWPNTQDASCLFTTSHKGNIGGGELFAHQIASVFDEQTDMRYYGKAPGREFRKNHDFTHRFKHTGIAFRPDILVSSSHFDIPKPTGKHRNVLVVFFPNKDHKPFVQGYDTIITISQFSKRWVKKYWGKNSVIINPYIDPYKFKPNDEVPRHITVMNVGRFFKEADGHGKRQDILIEAFAELKDRVPDATMVLAGSTTSPDDEKYVEECKDLSKSLGVRDSISFQVSPNVEELINLYQSSQFYWHANGYKQDDPLKTEHFGIVIVEAMACGCEPIIYKHGGYEEFNCPTWTRIDQLVDTTVEQMKLHEIENWHLVWQDEALKYSRGKAVETVFELIGR